MKVENMSGYQERFQAWLQAIGAQRGDEVHMCDYMAWINKHCSDFKKQENTTRLSKEGHVKFTAHLFKQAENEQPRLVQTA